MHVLHRSAVASTLAAFAALALTAPHARADTSGADIVGYVNAQRAANGLPAGIVEDTAASAACATWDGGKAQGSHDLPPDGAVTWNNSSGFADIHGPWTATADPFEIHPFSLPLVLAPRLDRLGAADVGGIGCATLFASAARPAPAQDVVYAYPGDGTQDIRTSQTILRSESLPRNAQVDRLPNETGPYLYVFFDGPDLDPAHPATTKVTSATLLGPNATAIPIDVHDSSTPDFPSTLPTEVQVIPHDSLAPFTTYVASVTADVTLPGGGPTRSFTRTWSFTTGALENSVGFAGAGALGTDKSKVSFEVQSRAPVVTLTATGPGTPVTTTATIAVGTYIPQWVTVQLDRPGTWHVCLASGGAGTNSRPAAGCQDFTAGAVPPIVTPSVPPTVPVAMPKLVVKLATGAKARLRGRVLSVPVRCSAACTLKVAGTVRAGGHATHLRAVTIKRKRAGTVTVKYTLSKAAAHRLRAARSRRLALTIAAKGAATVRRTVAISAK